MHAQAPSTPDPRYRRSRTADPILYRSPLEAYWAAAFEALGLAARYAPLDPTGLAVAPDFYVEEIGYVIVRPRMEALLAVAEDVHALACALPRQAPAGHLPRLLTITSPVPALAWPGQPHSVVEWSADGVRGGGKAFGLRVLCPPHARTFRQQHPDAYTDHVDRALRCAQQVAVEVVLPAGLPHPSAA